MGIEKKPLCRVVLADGYVETQSEDGEMWHRYYVEDHDFGDGHVVPMVNADLLAELYHAQDLGFRIKFELGKKD